MTTKEAQSVAFMKGGGEMGELIRKKDWSKTPLGPPELWPQSLRTSVSILLNSQFPMFVWWGKELTTIYNDSYRIIAGEKHPKLLGQSGKEGWAEIWKDLDSLVEKVFKGGSTWSEDQLLYINRRGFIEETYFTFSYSPVLDETGKVNGLFCAVIETTDKVLATRKILESERNLRATILQSPVAMCIFRGAEFVVEVANERMFEIWGKQPKEVLHKPIFEGLPEIRNQGLEELMQNVMDTGQSYKGNERQLTLIRNGMPETIYVNFVYEPFREGDGTISGIIAVATDVTEQVMVRKKIEENKEELQLAIEIAELGTFQVDWSSYTGTYNDKVRDWFGFKDYSNNMDTIFSTINPDDQERVVKGIQQSLVSEKNSRHDITYRVVNKLTGQERHLRSIGKAFFNKEGKAYQIRGVIQDVTPQIQYQKKMKESEVELQKRVEERTRDLESLNRELKSTNANLEEFAYAASHDMKEPIRKIHFFSDRLKNELGDKLTDSQNRLFDRLENAAQRMGTLIDDLLAYSQASRGAADREDIDLNQKLRNVLDDLELEVQQKNARIHVDTLPTIRANRRQLQQLFQNLISNGIKYSKPDVDPEITISYRKVKGKDIKPDLPAEEANKPYHLIEVKDNGIGFEQKDAERIFNVFTRLHGNAEYRGTGIGLSIVRKVAENLGGFVIAESTPGKGATFKVLLPVEA